MLFTFVAVSKIGAREQLFLILERIALGPQFLLYSKLVAEVDTALGEIIG